MLTTWLLIFLQGVTHLFDNVLSHPTLKTLLPELRNLLHDTAEKVRIAFVEMLLKAKGIRTFKVTLGVFRQIIFIDSF